MLVGSKKKVSQRKNVKSKKISTAKIITQGRKKLEAIHLVSLQDFPANLTDILVPLFSPNSYGRRKTHTMIQTDKKV